MCILLDKIDTELELLLIYIYIYIYIYTYTVNVFLGMLKVHELDKQPINLFI